MAADVLAGEKTRKESFVVNIQFQQNATWQGTITWIEQKKTVRFRSTLEMIKLMDSAVSDDVVEEETNWK